MWNIKSILGFLFVIQACLGQGGQQECEQFSTESKNCLEKIRLPGVPSEFYATILNPSLGREVFDCFLEHAAVAYLSKMCTDPVAMTLMMVCGKDVVFNIAPPQYKLDALRYADKFAECLATAMRRPMPLGRSFVENENDTLYGGSDEDYGLPADYTRWEEGDD